MMRWLVIAGILAACADPRDLYVGGDVPRSLAIDASTVPPGAGAPPPSVEDASAPDAGRSEPDAAAPVQLPVTCAPFAADCDGDAANGCETDLRSDRAHCGACGSACPNADCVCRDGKQQQVCRPGRADCDGMTANGCEVDIQTDLRHCGACSRRCHTDGHDALTATCTAGRCQLTCEPHPFPQIDCDGNADNGCETQAWIDDQNCGMCGVRCACNNGTCG
jgi:hypothetical protein